MPENNELYADVNVDILTSALNRTFQYRIPEGLRERIVIGSTVNVPFGKGQKLIRAYVMSIGSKAEIASERIKDIDSVVTGGELTESTLVLLAAWISRNYGSSMAAALRVVFPVKKDIAKKEKKIISLLGDERLWQSSLEVFEKKHQVARLRLLKELLENKELPQEIVTGKLGCNSSVIKALSEKGLCEVSSHRVYRQNTQDFEKTSSEIVLNEEQQHIYDGIIGQYDASELKPSLIKGITGSGKTQVYISLVREFVSRGKQAIVLIPEIALTYQTIMRFYRVFGDRAALMHSRLSAGERYDLFERARAGEIDVVIGPRSALFAPLAKLGIIIIDEEHENSYKSEQMPKYHARETAIKRAQLSDAIVVMGSATPTVESYYKAMQGEYAFYELKKRATGAQLAQVSLVDLREELRNGNKTVISEALKNAINERLERKEQVILFLNRRGFAGFVSCRSCGYTYKCPHCDVSLSLHRGSRLVCHYCGYEEPAVKLCKKCGSKYVGSMKAGTEAIELACQKIFPSAKTLRMDLDTTKGKDGHEKILSAFMNQEADILIGTQMIVKGHDFPNVTLVAALAADMSLYAADYKAGERTFQLLTQAAGRAGRGDKRGEVIIQTYNPQDKYIVLSALQDYEGFYETEMEYRRLMGYPPAGHLLAFLLEGADENLLKTVAGEVKKQIEENAQKGCAGEGELTIIGPSKASIAYINDIHRLVFYIKCKDYDRLVEIKDLVEEYFRNIQTRPEIRKNKCTLQVDFDPAGGY